MSSGWDQQNLARLRAILQSLILEEETVRAKDSVRADHLRDAITDTRTLISRLDPSSTADSGGFPRPPATERRPTAQREEGVSDQPREWKTLAHMSSAF